MIITINNNNLIPAVFPLKLTFVDDKKFGCGAKPNAFGYLVFFKAGTLEQKRVFVRQQTTIEQTYVIPLDGTGSIPSNILLYFNCFDENNLLELYDIWVYNSTFDPTQDYTADCSDVSLVEILRNQPFYAQEYIDSQTVSTNAIIQTNLLDGQGQFEAMINKLGGEFTVERNSVNQFPYYSNFEYITNNMLIAGASNNSSSYKIKYEYKYLSSFQDPALEGNPDQYLQITIPANQQAYLIIQCNNFRIPHKKWLNLSFFAKAKATTTFDPVLQRFFCYPSTSQNQFTSNQFSLSNEGSLMTTSTIWTKCTTSSLIEPIANVIEDASLLEIQIKFPNKTSEETYSFTNIALVLSEEKVEPTYAPNPSNRSIFASLGYDAYNRAKTNTPLNYTGRVAMYTNIGLSPSFECNAGKIEEFIAETTEDRPTSIFCDGRLLWKDGYYTYRTPLEQHGYPTMMKIPYQNLYNAIKDTYIPKNHFHVRATNKMSRFLGTITTFGEVFVHWNFTEFAKDELFDKGTCTDVMETNYISAGVDESIHNNFMLSAKNNLNNNKLSVQMTFKQSSHLERGYFLNPTRFWYDDDTTGNNNDGLTSVETLTNYAFSEVRLPNTFFSTTDSSKSWSITYSKAGVISKVLTWDKANTFPSTSHDPITTASKVTSFKLHPMQTTTQFSSLTAAQRQDFGNFMARFQVMGEPAMIIKLKKLSNQTLIQSFAGKYFIIKSRAKLPTLNNVLDPLGNITTTSKATNNYLFYFITNDEPAPSVENIVIATPINISKVITISDIANFMQEAMNSVIFAIPNLQGVNLIGRYKEDGSDGVQTTDIREIPTDNCQTPSSYVLARTVNMQYYTDTGADRHLPMESHPKYYTSRYISLA